MKKSISRRRFVKQAVHLGMAAGLPASVGSMAGCGRRVEGPAPAVHVKRHDGNPDAPKVLILSIDSLDPRVLDLDRRGRHGGEDGNRLMPNVRSFLEKSTWFVHTRCHMPAATDMNHLNAVAGTSSAQTGIIGVSLQLFDWREDGTPNIRNTNLSFARDDRGRPVDTLFNAWKRRWPRSRTLYGSGKGWVAEMFRTPGGGTGSGIDLFLQGEEHPSYIESPKPWSFYDPPGDEDGKSDEESFFQRLFCRMAYERRPASFPSDHWMTRATLRMLDVERPDLAAIVFAQMDDAQHGLGALEDPELFVDEWTLRHGTIPVHRYNAAVFKEPILDAMRDVDRQFGWFVEEVRRIPCYRDALIVLYSDHGHVTHRDTTWSNLDHRMNTDVLEILRDAGVITHRESEGKGVYPLGGSSVGALYIRSDRIEERQARAKEFKEVLLDHEIWHGHEDRYECPWFVLAEQEMIQGVPGLCAPGELYHAYYARNTRPGTLHCPDLAIFMKKGWQLPLNKGLITNLGARMPWYMPDNVNIFYGGHGSNDTAGVVMAMNGPDVPAGRRIEDPSFEGNYRLSDIAVTLANRYGLELRTTTVGRDRSDDLA